MPDSRPGLRRPTAATGTRRPAGSSTTRRPAGNRATGSERTHTTSAKAAAGTRVTATTRSGAQRRPATKTRPINVTKRSYKPVRRIPLAPSGGRLRWTIVLMSLVLVVCAARLVQLQGFDTQAYAAKADQQSLRLNAIPAQRGTITDRNGVVLASTEPAVNIFADAVVIDGDEESEAYRAKAESRRMTLAGLLARHLGGSPYDYLSALTNRETRQSYVRKQVPAGVWRAINDERIDAGLSGLYKETNPVRSYPAGTLGGNIVGFINAEGVGSAGLEQSFDHLLSGTDGEEAYDISNFGRIPLGANVVTPAVDGHNVQTTIDADLQASVELAVRQAVETYGAESGFAIVMNTSTGEVQALAQSPSYDPGRYGEYKQETLGLKAVTDAYEPGSVQKVLTMAAALDAGIITPDTQLDVPAKLMSGGFPITDQHTHTNRLNVRGVMIQSSNVGTAMIGRQMTRAQYFDYMDRFGLANKTGIELPGEGTGAVDYDMTDAQLDRAFFGQSLSVTGIQEAAAIAAVANGGVYNPPTIVKQVTDANGKVVPTNDTREARRVISATAAAQTLDLMENVVTDPGYKDLPIPNYRLAGKTGTAERYEPTCGCYRGNTVSFVGIGSVENPSLLVYLVLDKPTKGNPSGATMAAPVVSDILKIALPRYGVPISTQPARIEPSTW